MAPSGLYARLCHAFLVVMDCDHVSLVQQKWKSENDRIGRWLYAEADSI